MDIPFSFSPFTSIRQFLFNLVFGIDTFKEMDDGIEHLFYGGMILIKPSIFNLVLHRPIYRIGEWPILDCTLHSQQ